jgi:phosphatidylglycerophosphate synthase
MRRPHPIEFFRQGLKSNAFYADELINIYLLRPLAALFVWIVYPTRITPNQVTLLAILIGCAAGFVYLIGTPTAVVCGGALVLLKDITDDADGQLARAKELYSRRGRFLDSIGDVLVNIVVFTAVTIVVYRDHPSPTTIALGLFALVGITLRVSYHVYYQASFLHGENRYTLNRIIETVTEEDRRGDQIALRLQQVFIIIYGWQDRLIYRIDHWSLRSDPDHRHLPLWYGDRFGLRLSGLLGFGTELTLLALFSWCQMLYPYLVVNCVVMNGVLLGSIFYRRFILAPNIPRLPSRVTL